MKKIIYTLTLITFLIIGIVLFYNYINKETLPTQKINSVTSISVNNLDHKITSTGDLKKLNHLIEKAIQIEGVLKKIERHNKEYTLTISSENNKIDILCKLQLDQNNKIKTLKIGKNITLKGIYKGYLIEMILLNCIII